MYLVIFIHFCFFSRFTHGSCHKRGTARLISIIHARTIIKEALIFNRCVQLSLLHEYDRSARLGIASFPSSGVRNAHWTQGTGQIALYSTVQFNPPVSNIVTTELHWQLRVTTTHVNKTSRRYLGTYQGNLVPREGREGTLPFFKRKSRGDKVGTLGVLILFPVQFRHLSQSHNLKLLIMVWPAGSWFFPHFSSWPWHQHESWVDRIRWFVWNHPPKPRPRWSGMRGKVD